jgi:hypothetical protein
LGRRSRRTSAARGTSTAPAAPTPAPAPGTAPDPRPRRSTEEKNAEARAGLEPLAPGERPAAVTVAAVVCAVGVLALAVGALTGLIDSGHGRLPSLLLSIVILAGAGVGMWFGRYWAVLGFEAILLLNIIVMFGLLLRASNVRGLLIALAVIVPSSFLFYKLIRAMARIQMPTRSSATTRS